MQRNVLSGYPTVFVQDPQEVVPMVETL